MKRIISFVLVFAMLFSFAIPASAVENFGISMEADCTELKKGESVTLTVSVNQTVENVGVFQYQIVYDPAKVTYTGSTKGAAYSGTVIDDITSNGVSYVQFYGQDVVNVEPFTLTEGQLGTVTFTAKDDVVVEDEITFTLRSQAMADYDGQVISVAVSDPISITVAAEPECEHTYVAGVCTKCEEADPDYEVPSVTGILSLSADAEYMTGDESGEVMAFKEITVPYFDLALYGLEEYYFVSESYGDDGDGLPGSDLVPGTAEYADGKVTMLHLLIYALEVYYCDVPEEDAGKGYLYDEGLIGTDVFTIQGGSGSGFMSQFWGGDCNLNYYVNHEYPLASEGWGATVDQILLRDGDLMTLGHFSGWNFYADPYSIFNYIVASDDSPTEGEEITLKLYYAGPNMDGSSGTAQNENYRELDVYYVPVDEVAYAAVTDWDYLGTTDANGELVVDTAELGAGEYIVAVAGQPGEYYPDEICSAPGGTLLTVKACNHNYTDGVCGTCGATDPNYVPPSNDVTVWNGELEMSGNADITVTELILKDAKGKVFANYFSPDTGKELFVFLDGDKAAVGDSFEFAFTAEGADKDKAEFRIVDPLIRNKFTIQSYSYDMGNMEIQCPNPWGSVNFSVKLALVTKFGLNSETLTLTTGNEGTLSLSTNSGDINTWLKPIVEWTTSDANVATVDGGKVTAVAPGTATITATVGNKTATCTVTVECDHDWSNANGVCAKSDCGYICTHDWQDATCMAPKTCSICSLTEGQISTEHNYDKDGKCTVDGCDAEDPSANDVTVWTGVSQQKYSNLDFYVSEWYIEDGRDFVLGSVVTYDASTEYGNTTTLTIVDGEQIKVGSKINLGAVIEGDNKDKVNSITGNVATIQNYGFYMDQMRVTPTDYYTINNRFNIYPINKFEFAQAELTMLDSETPTLILALDSYFDMHSTPHVMSLVQWISSDEDVVTVEGGVLTAKGTGTATITAKVGNEYVSKTATCTVTVECDHLFINGICDKCDEPNPDYKPIESIEITSHTTKDFTDETTGDTFQALPLTVGASEKLVVTLNEGANQGITWTVENHDDQEGDVVSVENGVVTALRAGTATITATAGGADVMTTFDLRNTPVQATYLVVVEAAPTDGYTVTLPADFSVTAGSPIEIPVTLGHAGHTAETPVMYNAFDISVSYPQGLTLTSTEIEGLEVTTGEGTVRIQGYGEARTAGTVPFTLTFSADTIKDYVITVTSAKVDNSTGAIEDDAPDAALIDGNTVVSVTGYNVTLPDGFEGESVAAPGAPYTFTVPADLYDYTVTVKAGNETILENQKLSGSYTIPAEKVTGEIDIDMTKEGKKFTVTTGDHIDGAAEAQYEVDYTATLDRQPNNTYTVVIKIGDVEYTGYRVVNDVYTIPGGDITGNIEFIVTATPSGESGTTMWTVKFEGDSGVAPADTEVADGGTYTFELDATKMEAGYTYAATSQDTTLTFADGKYTTGKITSNIVITITKTLASETTVEVSDYVNKSAGMVKLIRVKGTLADGKVFAYNGEKMYYSEQYEAWTYLDVAVGETAFTAETARAKISTVAGSVEEQTITVDYDVNVSGTVDINDAQLAYDIYKPAMHVSEEGDVFATVDILRYLQADVNNSKSVDTTDAAAVVAQVK